MSAIRLPLLCAFAGGCLSGAVLLGVWRAETAATVFAPKHLARHTESSAAANVEQAQESSEETPPAPLPAAQRGSATLDAEAAAPAGSTVSDVLTDLETAYRRRLAAAAPAEAPPTPMPTNPAIAQAGPPPEAPPPEAPPREVVELAAAPVVAVTTAVAPAAVAPATVVTPPVPPAASEPPVAAAPAFAPPVDARPPDVHYGDVNNTYISNVRQGDVYVMQQQIAMMQYMQLLGASSPPLLAMPARSRPLALLGGWRLRGLTIDNSRAR